MTNAPWRSLALAGPTASGKSAAAMAIAQRWPVEIISVDSAQVFIGMDIGTAKPTPAERAAVPHHLIDILDPTERYSAAQFVLDARRLIGEIHARQRHALLVGGTLLYFKALIDGLDAMPAADSAVRADIDARAAALGWPALHAELQKIDPATAARLAPNDAQRIQRALEVWQLSGEPLSALHGRRISPGLNVALISLEPASRAWLHQRIGQRFDAMLAAGLTDEVSGLMARGDLHPGLPAMRCVGYRQAWAALADGNLAALREQGVAATRQLAKRQLTWLRSMPQRRVVACDRADVSAATLGLAASVLG